MDENLTSPLLETENDNVDGLGKPLFEKHLRKRRRSSFNGLKSNARLYLRYCSIFIMFFSVIPIYYSIIFCEPQEFKLLPYDLINPAFNIVDMKRKCYMSSISISKGIIALSLFYALKKPNKMLFFVHYLTVLLFFSAEVVLVKVKWSEDVAAITGRERMLNTFDLSLMIFIALLYYPYIVIGYHLLRHVHMPPTTLEMDLSNDKYKEDARRINDFMNSEERHAINERKNKQSMAEEEGLQMKDTFQKEELYRFKIKSIREKEQLAKQKRMRQNARRRENRIVKKVVKSSHRVDDGK